MLAQRCVRIVPNQTATLFNGERNFHSPTVGSVVARGLCVGEQGPRGVGPTWSPAASTPMFAAAPTALLKPTIVQGQRLRGALIQWRSTQMKRRLEGSPSVSAKAANAFERGCLRVALIQLGIGIGVALATAAHTAMAQQVLMPVKPTHATNAVALTEPATPSNAAEPSVSSPSPSPSRGELLYATHCISCHSKEMHWRDKRVANNWVGLKKQVRRWQDVTSLSWNESDITEVARYLNDTIYLFEKTVEPISSLSQERAASSSAMSAPAPAPAPAPPTDQNQRMP